MKLLWKAKMTTIQDGVEEVEEGAVYRVTLKRVQIQQAANKGVRWLAAEGDKLPPEHTVSQYETCKVRTIKAGTLEKLVENLLTAFGDNDFTYISIFLSTYRAFSSTKEVLELLLDRFGNLEISICEEVHNEISSESRRELRIAIASILRAWLDQCSEDFREPPSYPCLLKLLDYLKKNIPGSDPEKRARSLLEQFQSQEMEIDDGLHNPFLCNLSDEEELEINIAEELEFSSFQDSLVAEQLTYMDATLFKKVESHYCLGSIWSRRDKEENRHLVPTIKATISQFNAVTKCVIRTILKTKEVKMQQRAKIIEKWIHVAQECRLLKNFSSLRAVVSALKSYSIYRLKKTWAYVSKDAVLMLEELSGIFSDSDNHLTSRELLMKEGTSKFANLDSSVKENQKRTQRRLQLQKDMGVMQGTVPYLGIFLTDLIMLDSALQDYIEGGLINFEKRRKEFEVIAQIKLLQSACNSYCMTPDPRFLQWFKQHQHLTDEESYSLSYELESVPDSSTTPPKSRKSVVKRISLLFLSSEMAGHSTPIREQPAKLAVHGGSFEESTDSSSVSSEEASSSPRSSESSSKLLESTEEGLASKESAASEQPASPPAPMTRIPSFPPLQPLFFKDEDSVDTTDGGGVPAPAPSPISSPKALHLSSRGCVSKDESFIGPGDVTSSKSPLPVYNEQREDACIIRVSVNDSKGNMYKSLLLTCQDKTHAVIRRAMQKHNLDAEAADDYELVQVISKAKVLALPWNANVFYAMNTRVNFDFILRKKAAVTSG